MQSIGRMHQDTVGVMIAAEDMNTDEIAVTEGTRRTTRPQTSQHGGRTYDALTKQLLDEELVIHGKLAEMDFIRQWNVYDYADYEEVYAETGRKPISTRWVCTNKGDDMVPNIRCRWVARDFRDEQDVIFAATAPYESIRLLLSIAAAMEESTKYKKKCGAQRLQVSLVDIKRAYFNAMVADDTPIFVELPPEDPEYGKRCGRLRRHLYGTRGAAAGWEEEYTAFLLELGFQRGIASGCLFFHPSRDLRVAVYGDDFTSVGSCQELNWLEGALEARYAITRRGRLGSGSEDAKELTLLNRVVRWVDGKGIEVEADPRQAERLVAQLGLIGANPLSTPGVKPTVQELESDDLIYDERGHVYQSGSARGNYMGLDCPETQYAIKECCRWMSAPTELALKSLKRVGRFVEGHRRLVMNMNFEDANQIDVYVDSDYAGCPRTRKSTSGGCIMMGTHLIKSWSSTQNNVISLSLGEAELYALVKGVGAGMGVQQYLRDLGIEAGLRVHTDSSAAKGICKRVGLGTQRHIAVNSLWVQEKLRRREFTLFKVNGGGQPSRSPRQTSYQRQDVASPEVYEL